MVGACAADPERRRLHQALLDGSILREEQPCWLLGVPVRREVVPVRLGDQSIAVLGREANLTVPRVPSPLEIAYLGVAADLCQMLADGTFPDADTTPDLHGGPQAGDGLLRVDAQGIVIYASPNALSAYHRMGHAAELRGERLALLTRALISDSFDGAEVAQRILGAIQGRPSTRIEAEAAGATMLFRALPLRPRAAPAGALVLVRDVTELPLVMVLTELVQNALEHAFEPGSSGEVVLRAERSAGSLEVTVSDDGRGLPADFSLARAERLGLQIVRTLVGSELRGSLDLQRGQPRGTVAVLSLPVALRR